MVKTRSSYRPNAPVLYPSRLAERAVRAESALHDLHVTYFPFVAPMPWFAAISGRAGDVQVGTIVQRLIDGGEYRRDDLLRAYRLWQDDQQGEAEAALSDEEREEPWQTPYNDPFAPRVRLTGPRSEPEPAEVPSGATWKARQQAYAAQQGITAPQTAESRRLRHLRADVKKGHCPDVETAERNHPRKAR